MGHWRCKYKPCTPPLSGLFGDGDCGGDHVQSREGLTAMPAIYCNKTYPNSGQRHRFKHSTMFKQVLLLQLLWRCGRDHASMDKL